MEELSVNRSSDEFGEPEVPVDWREGLPADLLGAIEDFVLIEDSELGVKRADAIQFLLNMLLDADDSKEIEAFVRKHIGSDFVLARDANGRLEVVNGRVAAPTKTVTIPEALFSALADQVLVFPDEDQRLVREVSLREGIGDATDWLVDQEKLLGHLILDHKVRLETALSDHDALLAAHARFHRLPNHRD